MPTMGKVIVVSGKYYGKSKGVIGQYYGKSIDVIRSTDKSNAFKAQ